MMIIWLSVFLATCFFGAVASLTKRDSTVPNVITGFFAVMLFVVSVIFAADQGAQRKIEFEKTTHELVSTKD